MDQLAEFVANHPILVGAFAVIVGLLIAKLWAGATAAGDAVSPAEAVRLVNHEDALVVDLREAADFKRGHIVGARHLPYSQLEQRLGEIEGARARPVVLACDSGAIAGKAAGVLRKAGFERVYRLRGGMLAWQNDNLPLARGSE